MAADVVIRAEGLGKKFIIGHQTERESYVALRDVISRNARNLVRSTSDLLRGRPNVVGDTVEEFWALRGLSFEVRRGEVLGVIGRNGAGKSTLLKILSRITEPTEGRVEIHGRVASLLEVGTGFHPELTGRENIYLNGAVLGMTHAEIRRKFDEIVAFSGVEKFLDTPVKRYSNGMYVRLAFAVAAHLEPEILVIDEVLAVGDAEFQKKCLGKMGEVASHGRTVLFVSHNMSAVANLCPQSCVLDGGRLVFSGPTNQAVVRYLEKSRRAPVGADGAAYVRDPTKPLGEAAVMAVRLADQGEGGFFESSSRLVVQVEVAAPVQDIPLSAFVRLVDCTNAVMCKFESDPSAVRLTNGQERATVELEIEALPCMPGDYSIDVGVAHCGSHIIEFVEGAAHLTVTPTDDLGVRMSPWAEGFVAARNEWRMVGMAGRERSDPSDPQPILARRV
jgi:lipopolysaccharide transport system ATP-binding protein